MDLQPGALFDRYRIEQPIGEGGVGRVYRAYDTRLQRLVALKVLAGAGSAEKDARFVREARAVAALNHPNVVSIFDVGETADAEPVRFIAMELIEGRDLRSLGADPRVTMPTRLRWLADAARALVAAHRAGLVHRDVKPENVMVREDGTVKVLDFGLARRTAATSAPPGDPGVPLGTVTEQGIVVGTPMYMSPEQLRGDVSDGRTDQFAWAVMAYELLSGGVPWRHRTQPVHLIAEILATPAPALAERSPDLDPAICQAIMKALSKEQVDRFPSMDAIVELLDDLAPGGAASRLPPPGAGTALAFAPTVQSTRTSLAAARLRASLAPRRRWRHAAVGLALASTAALTALLALRTRAPGRSVAPQAAPPAPTAITALEIPAGAKPEAVAEYMQAMQRVRFADLHGAAEHAQQAVTLDPDFAPALLWLGMRLLSVNGQDARDFFRRAEEHAERLSDRDRVLMDAFKPLVQGSPPDARETRVRLERAVQRFPLDAGLHAELANIDGDSGDIAAAIAESSRALELDPGFGSALTARAFYEAVAGDVESALKDSERCAALAPSVPNCMALPVQIERDRGQCAEVADRMSRAIVIEPAMPDWYAPLAEALFALGKPLDAVREAAAQGQAHATPSARPGLPFTYYPIVVDILGGELGKADEELRAAEASPDVANSLDPSVHALPLALRIAVAWETGRDADAADMAQRYLARRDAWPMDLPRDSFSLSKDVEPRLLRALERAKRIDTAEEERRRSAWIDRRTKDTPYLRGFAWLLAYADDIDTPEEGARAVAVLPRFEPLPTLEPDWAIDARVGRARFLAGDSVGALPALRRAGASCTAIAQPFEMMHALASLGEVLERTDKAGACTAYGRVLAAWGRAKPRSVTAERVRARARAIGCAGE